MERLMYILFEFGYVLVFGILGSITLFLQTNQEKGIEYYTKARKTLGIALMSLSCYCIYRLFDPQDHHNFSDFWILTTFTLIFSWMTYATILFLIETPRYKIKHFLIDGLSPTVPMVIMGIIGMCCPKTQTVIKFILGAIFTIKCSWMLYVCIREYRRCNEELENYYAEGPDTKWIRLIIYIASAFSVITVTAFYVTSIHPMYYFMTPILYTFFVFKIINFAPKKIDAIRRQNTMMTEKPESVKKISADLELKIQPLLIKWVEQKGFCKANITIKDVAIEIGTNHNYLSQYINKHLKLTFQVWLNTLRIEESKILLTDGAKRSIEAIGEKVGFSQLYNYSRWFKIITGTTPFQYRKQSNKASIL